MLLTQYMDLARERAGIGSDNRLAAALEISQATVSAYRRGLAVPTPARMVRLAQLAGMDPAAALLHRASWQADDQASRDVMSRILASWMEEPPRNPLNIPRSLGAAATVSSAAPGRLRYIMERAALLITRGINGLACRSTDSDTWSLATDYRAAI